VDNDQDAIETSLVDLATGLATEPEDTSVLAAALQRIFTEAMHPEDAVAGFNSSL
jgi:FXSXX-COOH protein